jgi:outer membrane protein TolC
VAGAASTSAPTPAPVALTLDAAIGAALAENPQIKVEAYGRSIARADLLAAAGYFDPAITFRRSYSEDWTPFTDTPLVNNLVRTDNYSLALEGTTPWGLNYSIGGTAQNQRLPGDNYTDNYLTFGGIAVTQPLLRGFGLGANLQNYRLAKADRGIADWQFRQTVIDTVTNVIVAYSEVAYSQQLLRIAQRSRDLSAGLLTENERRFQVGSMSENDVTQARARTATRDEAILFAEQGLRNSINRLRQLMGATSFAVEPEALLLEPADVPPAAAPVNAAEDLKIAYALRPDYQAAKLGVVKRAANNAAARNELLPQVDLVASYGYNGLDRDFGASRRMVRDRENRSYSIGAVVKVPLTFAEGRGRARSARLRLLQGEADLARIEQDIAISIARAAGEIDTTRRRVEANRRAYTLAKEALDAELKKLRAGTSNTFFVLNLQSELAGAENSFYNALADQRRARAQYDRELGRTLEVHHLTLAKE